MQDTAVLRVMRDGAVGHGRHALLHTRCEQAEASQPDL